LKEISSSNKRNNNNSNSNNRFKIGMPKQFFFDIIHPYIMEIFREFVEPQSQKGLFDAEGIARAENHKRNTSKCTIILTIVHLSYE
jgi:hypothetical protein